MKTSDIKYTLLLLVAFICNCDKNNDTMAPEPQPLWIDDSTKIYDILDQIDTSRIWQNMVQLSSYADRDAFGETIDNARDWIWTSLSSSDFDLSYHRFLLDRYSKIYMLDETYGWLVRSDDIAHTTDKGVHWNKIDYPQGSSAQTIFFLNSDIGFMASNAFYMSSDGGLNWGLRNASRFYASHLFFSNLDNGYMLEAGSLYTTEDGGYSWTRKNFSGFIHIDDIFFLDENIGWIRSGENIYRTDNGWESIDSLGIVGNVTEYFEEFFFINQLDGICLGFDAPVLYFTTDSGYTWTPSSLNDHSIPLNVSGIPPDHFWIASQDEHIFYSNNYGYSWQKRGSFIGSPYDLYFVNETTGWLSTGYGLYKSIDGGFNWTLCNENFSIDLTSENIVFVIPGKVYPDQEILLIGHYDTVFESKGANDNSTGVCALLEMARIFSELNFKYTVKFIFFTGEEYNLRGSRNYSSMIYDRGDQVYAVLNFDVLGYWKEGLSRDLNINYWGISEDLATFMTNSIQKYTDILVTKNPHWGARSDDYSFKKKGYKTLWFSEAGSASELSPYINTTNDNLEFIDREFLYNNIKACAIAAASLGGLVKKRN